MISMPAKAAIAPKNVSDVMAQPQGEHDALMALFAAGAESSTPQSFEEVLGKMGEKGKAVPLGPTTKRIRIGAPEEMPVPGEMMAPLAGGAEFGGLNFTNLDTPAGLPSSSENVLHKKVLTGPQALAQMHGKSIKAPNVAMEKTIASEVNAGAKADQKSIFMGKDRLLERHHELFNAPQVQDVSQADVWAQTPMMGEIPRGQKMNEVNKLRALSSYKNALAEKGELPLVRQNMEEILSVPLNLESNAVTKEAGRRNFFTDTVKSYDAMVEKPAVGVKMKAEFLPQVDPSQFAIKHASQIPANIQTSKEMGIEQAVQGSENEIINRIAQHIESSGPLGKDLKFTVHSQELGKIEIQVAKKGRLDDVEIKIATQSKDAQDFFRDHRHELMNKLNHSGISVTELRIEGGRSDLMGNGNFGEKFAAKDMPNTPGNSEYNRNEEQNAREDSERRKELWDRLNTRA